MSYYHDPELPNGFQDADLEMAELTAAGNRSAALARKGICDHGWLQGSTCKLCGQVFDSFEDALAARAEVLS